MSEWEPSRTSHLQAGLAALALIGCVGLAGWQMFGRTRAVGTTDASADERVNSENAMAESSAGLRPSPIAQAAPPGAAVSLGTTMPHEGAAPRIDLEKGVIRWPAANPEDEWKETPLPTFTMENNDRALSIGADARFEASAVAIACGGVVATDLLDLEQGVGDAEMALLSELEGLMMRQEAIVAEADEAEAAQEGADAMQTQAEAACADEGLGPLSLYALADTGRAGRGNPLDEAAAIVKNMKPQAAAKLVETWDRQFAATAMARLPPRVAAPIFAKMNPEFAGTVTESMLAGLAFGGAGTAVPQ